jgi:hypothetical protein
MSIYNEVDVAWHSMWDAWNALKTRERPEEDEKDHRDPLECLAATLFILMRIAHVSGVDRKDVARALDKALADYDAALAGRVNRDCISSAEYDRRMEERRAAGLLLDPSTAEIGWNYAQTLDPYSDRLPLLPQEEQVGREYFARAPDSDIWVSVRDLPNATRDAIWKRFENTRDAILRIGVDADGQLRMTGFPPD